MPRDFGRRHLAFIAAWLAWAGGCGGDASPDHVGAVETSPAGAPAETADAAVRAELLAKYEALRGDGFAGAPEIRAAEVMGRLAAAGDVGGTAPAGTGRPAGGATAARPVVLVDCRDGAERAVSTIPGAISREAFEADPARFADADVVTYCTIGVRSGLYTMELRRRGVTAFNLVGGVLDWAHEGGAFVNGAGDPTKRVHTWSRGWNLLPADHEGVH